MQMEAIEQQEKSNPKEGGFFIEMIHILIKLILRGKG